jgi:hypothetical protein
MVNIQNMSENVHLAKRDKLEICSFYSWKLDAGVKTKYPFIHSFIHSFIHFVHAAPIDNVGAYSASHIFRLAFIFINQRPWHLTRHSRLL